MSVLSHSLRIATIPGSKNALNWSQDFRLAVTGEDGVMILVKIVKL